jgi:hypothetical protein
MYILSLCTVCDEQGGARIRIDLKGIYVVTFVNGLKLQ